MCYAKFPLQMPDDGEPTRDKPPAKETTLGKDAQQEMVEMSVVDNEASLSRKPKGGAEI